MAVLEYDTTGRIASGFFYEIMTTWHDTDVLRARSDWFIRPPDEAWPPLSATAVTLVEDEVRECPHNPTHCTAKRPRKIELDLSDGIEHEFVPEMSLLLVTKSLEAKIRTSGLTGATFFKAEILPNEDVAPDLEILAVYTSGLGSCLARCLSPPEANRCFKCGYSPILCPACGDWKWDCPECGNECFVLVRDHEGNRDRRISVLPTPVEGPIQRLGMAMIFSQAERERLLHGEQFTSSVKSAQDRFSPGRCARGLKGLQSNRSNG